MREIDDPFNDVLEEFIQGMLPHPLRGLQTIKELGETDPTASVELLAHLLAGCEDAQWVLLRDSGVIELVERSAKFNAVGNTQVNYS